MCGLSSEEKLNTVKDQPDLARSAKQSGTLLVMRISTPTEHCEIEGNYQTDIFDDGAHQLTAFGMPDGCYANLLCQ